MILQVNFKSGVPVYLQLVDQVMAAAASGVLRAGDSLPSIRPLAEDLRINRNTVAKAYSELENRGIIETQPGKGSVLAANHSPFKKEVRKQLLQEAVDAAIVKAHHLQVARTDFERVVGERLDDFEKRLKQSAS